ncbi:hypothetical protein M758_8G187000 [Ceratodon purpureus]|nr:hypothetical protein M758_8G187000 [Ceratodon purpureus]
MAGVWLCSAPWRDANLDLVPGLESLLRASNCNLKFIPGSFTTPDFIATIASGSTVAFIVVTNAAYLSSSNLWKRVTRMGTIFQTSYVLVTISSEDEKAAFNDAYFSLVESDNTPLLQIPDKTMAGEMMMELAVGHAELKRQGRSAFEKLEREKFVSTDEAYVTTITSIWGLDTHDANSLLAGIGCIQDVANASEEEILRKTDLSVEKARTIVSFFNSNVASQCAPPCD